MASEVKNWLNRRLPRNFIIEKSFPGTLILLGFNFCFVVLYRPFDLHGARSFSIETTMFLYNLILFIPVYGGSLLLKRFPYFSRRSEWTILKEILSILTVMIIVGVTVYFAGFMIETHSNRWTLSTFWGSMRITSLISAIPFAFFTLSNYRYLFLPEILQHYRQPVHHSALSGEEKMIQISSRLKKEQLSFYPSEFFYAESDGNYVDFYLVRDGNQEKKTIRNSMNEIERQLSSVPLVIRVHRAFIVNLRKVVTKKGNSLGYRLTLSDLDNVIPVSRNNTLKFDRQMNQVH